MKEFWNFENENFFFFVCIKILEKILEIILEKILEKIFWKKTRIFWGIKSLEKSLEKILEKKKRELIRIFKIIV